MKSFVQKVNLTMDFKENLPPLPGFIHPSTKTGAKYKKYYIPWMENMMAKNMMIPDDEDSASIESCWTRTACRKNLIEATAFVRTLSQMYPVIEHSGDFLEERPDFYLGRYFSMFANFMWDYNYALECEAQPHDDPLDAMIYKIFVEHFTVSIMASRYSKIIPHK